MLVGAAGTVGGVRIADEVDQACRDAARHAVRYLTFVLAQAGVRHSSVWTLPFEQSIALTPTHLTGSHEKELAVRSRCDVATFGPDLRPALLCTASFIR